VLHAVLDNPGTWWDWLREVKFQSIDTYLIIDSSMTFPLCTPMIPYPFFALLPIRGGALSITQGDR
jgi:hypothetical protein